MTKAEPVKTPSKLETVNLKVYIHCEGCRKKVKKIINSLDGVQTIVIDSNIGKVTVTGTVDSQTLIKKLEKAGKHAELWANPQSAGGKGNQQNQPKGGNKEPKATSEGGDGEGDGNSNGGGNKGGGNNGGGNNAAAVAGGNGGGGKKGGGKKGGGGGGGGGGDNLEVSEASSSKGIANKNVAPRPMVAVQTGYSLQSAEYATHMFSDENANNCHIM